MLKRTFLLLLSIILVFICYEFFLKISPFKYGLSPVIYDSKIGMWHKKDFSDYHIKECYKVKYYLDSNGLQKSILEYNKNKKDVIIIGDSYVEAFMVKNENIIHNSLAKEFNNNYNFLNYGLSGTSPAEQLIILKEKVNLENTKYVIQLVNSGDIMDVDKNNANELSRPKISIQFIDYDNFIITPPANQSLYSKLGDFFGNFELYSYLKKTIYFFKDIINSKSNVTNLTNTLIENDYTQNWLNLNGSIYQTKKLLDKHKIEYKILLNFTDEKEIDKIENFLLTQKIDFINLNNINNFELKSFSCDSHWNDETHIEIAKYIKNINFIK